MTYGELLRFVRHAERLETQFKRAHHRIAMTHAAGKPISDKLEQKLKTVVAKINTQVPEWRQP